MTKEIAKVENNEIDLMDLFRILYKNKVMIAVVTIVITLVSLGGALYVRANTNNKVAIDFKIKSSLDKFYLDKFTLNTRTFDEREIFKNQDIVDEILEESSLKEAFKSNGVAETSLEKRKFLEGLIELKKVEETIGNMDEFRYYQVNMEKIDEIDEEKVISKYLTILNREVYLPYKEAIDENYDEIKEKRDLYGKELDELDEQIRNLIDKEPEAILRNEGIVGVLSVKYPKTMREQNRVKELYTKYDVELTAIEGLKEDTGMEKQLEILSSYYEVEQKSKAKLILIIGMVLGLTLGIMTAFIKEFWMFFKKEIN